jgi:AMP phosphorylase
MLEVVMPVALTRDKIESVMKKENACLVWGGGIDLAPADDVLIDIERPLNIESHEKFLVSIIAKKVAMKVTHLIIDIPYGEGAKVENISEVEVVTNKFLELAERFDIKLQVYSREAISPDGHGIGPLLEIRDVLRIFERHPERPVALEDIAIDMAGQLLELAGEAEVGEGARIARGQLENGAAEDKFWSIAFSQGATKKVKSTDLATAEYSYLIKANKTGMISRIGNREVVEVARALGAPFIKEAGMYFHKLRGDNIEKGEPLVTLYATSPERLDLGKEVFEKLGDFIEI